MKQDYIDINKKRIFTLLMTTILILVSVSCKKHLSVTTQELKSWQGVNSPDINRQFTTEYMRSRPPRMVQKINDCWTFNYFPEEALNEKPAAKDYDDSKWPAIAVPHSWQSYEITRQLHPFVLNASEKESSYFGDEIGVGNPAYWWNGWGWYRKKIEFTIPVRNKRFFLEFDGIMKYCRVYLNGQYLGEHKGGFNPFYFEISEYVKQGKINTLAVAVRNKQDDEFRIPPMYSGNQVHTGGIYRDVRIVVKSPVYIPFQGSTEHEGGTFVTTPFVSKDSATVKVKTWIKNDTRKPVKVVLKTTIENANNKEICFTSSEKEFPAGEIGQFVQVLPTIQNPGLWSPDTPVLYKVNSFVYVNDELTDHYESPLGFRTFQWDYNKNIGILNGNPIHIHGTNRTQQFPWLNNAIPEWIDIMDIADIRFGLGHNFIRPNIHPNNLLIHDLFDQWGMLVNLGSPMIKDIDFSEEVQEQMVREAVRQHRNRPSIVFYSVGNETNDGADSKWIYGEDSTRIIHARKVTGGKGDYVTHDHTNMDMENLLRVTVRGWTDSDIYPDNPDNGQLAGNEKWQHERATVQDGSVRGRIDMPNGVMWMYSDDGAARVYKNCPLKNINPKGWVDPYRIPKYMYFLWQANYATEPMAFIHPHLWQEKYIGTEQDVIIDSNCDKVTLFVDGKKVGTKMPDKENFHVVKFDNVMVQQGNLKVIGQKQKGLYEFVLPMAGKPHKLRIKSSHNEIQAKRNSVVTIMADVVDREGNQVQAFNNVLNWEVEGPASLIGPSHWETDIYKNNADSGAWYIVAPVLNLIRSNGEPGNITIKVSSAGLAPSTVKIQAVPGKKQEGSFVREYALKNEGRKPVEWKVAFEMIDGSIYPKMMPVEFDFHLDVSKESNYYLKYFTNFMKDRNPELSGYTNLIEVIAEHFTEHIMKNNGILVADDYNFMVERVNKFLRASAGHTDNIENNMNKKYLRRVIEKGDY